MYNEERKNRFIDFYQRESAESLDGVKFQKTVGTIGRIFRESAPYEEKLGADICTMSGDELQNAIENIASKNVCNKQMLIHILRKYSKWCLVNNVSDANDSMQKVDVIGVDDMRARSVSSPFHLQMLMDRVFDPIDVESLDILYRCYLWMAFGGVQEANTILIKDDDVDLENMVVHSPDGYDAPIYREAVPAFIKAIKLEKFYTKRDRQYVDPHLKRAPGNLLLRGIRGDPTLLTLRNWTAQKITGALGEKRKEMELTYRRVFRAGIYFRAYESERAGMQAPFRNEAIRISDDQKAASRIKLNYEKEYLIWKLAFDR